MKKFSITKLEEARRTPIKFAQTLLEGDSGFGGYGYPKSVRWLDAVGVYHDTTNLSSATNSLVNSFSNRKDTARNRKEVEKLIQSLETYVDEHERLGYFHLERRYNIEILLSPKIRITGWIWLLNMTAESGRSGFIISKDISGSSWQDELRFPILQDYIANEIYGCNLDDVEVGIIDYLTGVHHITQYQENDVVTAVKELTEIGNKITSEI